MKAYITEFKYVGREGGGREGMKRYNRQKDRQIKSIIYGTCM